MTRTRLIVYSSLLIFVLVCAFLILTPFPWSDRERKRRANCMSNLKQIVYACDLYAKDNGGVFPPDLAALHGDYIRYPALYVCPTVVQEGGVSRPRSDSFLPDAVCYCYVSGLRASDDKEYVLAFDEEWNHRHEGIIVARVGGQVSWERDIEGSHARLDKQRAALAAEGRTMKVIRPTWSRWPDRPAYPVRPWHERPGPILGLVALALAIIGGAVALVVRQRRLGKIADEETHA